MYNEDYKKLIKSNYKITMISIKNNVKIFLNINNLFNLFSKIECVYRLPFGLYLKYSGRINNEGILIHYEPININDMSNELKRQFKNQYYLKERTKDYDLINYMIHTKKIPCKLMSTYPHKDKEIGIYYI
ncbi:hypothetical protein [Clostridioides difficile]|uniref:hypothetical protein n=1 Tax=Clostridioides difficile TaxID=1496 RepID=UPI001C1B99FE|nr:hypothetical protein [Clostridioides difficile]MDF3815453.1 hypothetical protein [Clostridioides difficile]HBF5050345.1 hypothetical protein [Clostridioides difficile]HBF5115892.1 hypothetical protein [Clostridioides difficile]HBF5876397.1 hypothetical protein [Clostridioides difficile]HBH3594404.1 hypothetical protein [Clostridioides difficile]